MEMLYKRTGERIFQLRSMRGYSRERLAEIAEISTKFLYEIEMGKTGFSVWILTKLCKALDVDCSCILSDERYETIE